MARNFGILLAAHGSLAKSALETLETLAGSQQGVETVALFPDMGREELRAAMEEKLEALAAYKTVLIVADLVGGTPANVASELLAARPELQLIGGANMTVLCEAAFADNLDGDAMAELLKAGGMSMQDLGAKVRGLSRDRPAPPPEDDL